jgi:hypothetical protein
MMEKGKQLVENAGGLVKDEVIGLIRDAKQTKEPLKEKALGLVKGRPLRLLKGAKREAHVIRRDGTTNEHSGYFRNLITETNRRSTGDRRSTGKAAASPEVAESQDRVGDDLPLEDYDSMNVHQIRASLADLSIEEVRRLRDYEARNKNRRTLIGHFDRRIEVRSSK